MSSKNKINFEKYVGKNIVLATNYAKTLNSLPLSIDNMKVLRYKQKYVLAKALTREDLQDEDFVDYLQNMWKTEEELDKFLKYSRD
jgi:hypothetical protein